MSDSRSGISEMIYDEVRDQVDVADLLGEGSIDEQVEADEIGAAVGGEFGERIGRELGEAIGREVHEAFSEGVERGDDLDELAGEIKTAMGDAIRETIGEVDDRESAIERLREIATEGSLGERASEALETDEAETDADEADDEPAEDETDTEADDSETEAEEEPDESESGVDAADLENLRRETLEDFLEVMSYRDLQSVAKDVGVKANLSRDEMTDEIIDTVADEGEPDSEGAGEEETEAA